MRPSCSDRVEAAQRRGRGGPVARLWRRTVEPGPNDHPVDVRAAIGRRDHRRNPEARTGQVAEQIDLPVKAGRLAPRLARHQPLLAAA